MQPVLPIANGSRDDFAPILKRLDELEESCKMLEVVELLDVRLHLLKVRLEVLEQQSQL